MTHIFVTGTRGIPDVPGGIETHCRELYPLVVEKGCRVTVAGRKPYLTSGLTRWKGVDILPVGTVAGQYGKAIVHTFLSILKAWSMKADLVHIHAVGPALLVPLAKLLGLTVVFTSHGPDYRKNKWGRLARVVLRCGEYAGDADHGTGYSRQLKQAIARDPDIVGTGYITGEKLNQVYSHAGLFVLPSFHEGLPIALLEAMSYGLSVLVSDIPANQEVGLAKERYFTCGDVNDLAEKIQYHLEKPVDMAEKARYRIWIEQKYNWERIAEQTVKVYEEALR